MSIMEKARRLKKLKRVTKTAENSKRAHYRVIGDTEDHQVILSKNGEKSSCDCKFYSLWSQECSHIAASKLERVQDSGRGHEKDDEKKGN